MLLLETETDDFFEQTRGWTPTSISMHVKQEQGRETVIHRTGTEVMSPSEVVFDPQHPLVSLNPRTNQFQHEIMTSMAKVRTRMGGTMGGNDEESRRFV